MKKNLTLILLLSLFLGLVTASGTLEVTTVDSSDNPLGQVRLDVAGASDTTAYTDSSGETEISYLDQGSHTITASKSGYEEHSEEFSIDYYGDKEQVELKLNEEAVIRGQATISVNDQDGNPIEGARIDITGASDTTAYTDSSGSTTVERLKEGSHNVIANKDGRSSNEESFSIDYNGDTEEVDLTIEMPDNEPPEPDLEVTPSEASVGEEFTFDASGSTDNRGIDRYKFDFDDDGIYEKIDYNDGVVEKRFSRPYSGYAEVKVYDEAGNSDTDRDYYDVEEDEETGSVTVNVRDQDGNSLDANVKLDSREERTGSDGSILFDDLEKDVYVVEVSKDGYTTETRQVDLNSQTDWNVDITLEREDTGPKTGNLKLKIEDDEPKRLSNAYVRVEREGSILRTGSTNSNGIIKFDDLKTGDYTVIAQCQSFDREKDITVIEGGYSQNTETINILHNFVNSNCGEFDSEPTADFDWTPDNPVQGEEVSFDGTLSSDNDAIESYEWDFGDGSTAEGSNPDHVFDDSGDYDVELTVTDSSGQQDSVERTVYVGQEDNPSPEADFTYSPTNPDVGEEVGFDASGSSDDGEIEDYIWEFGNGASDLGKTTSYTYSEQGTYPVTLTVVDDDGSSDSLTRQVTVGEPEDQCGIDQYFGVRFELEDYAIEEGGSTDAVLKIFNNAEQSQEMNVRFKLGDETVEERTVTVSGFDSNTVRQEISSSSDTQVKAEVSAVGGPCEGTDYPRMIKGLTVISDEEQDAFLEVDVEKESGAPLRDARVEVDGPEDRVRYTDSSGRTALSLEPGDYDVEVSHPNYRTEDKSVDLESGEEELLRFELEERRDSKGSLQVTAKDRDGDWIEDARVEVQNGDYEVDRTNSFGYSSFSLDEGSYDVEISKSGYRTRTDTVYIDEDERTSKTYRLYERGVDREGLEIVDVSHSSSVCRGATLSADVTVRNNADRDEYVTVTGNGLGSINVIDSFILDEGDEETKRVRFTNVEGSVEEEFRIRARNGTDDEVHRTVDVEDCEVTERQDRDPSSVSMKLSYPIQPNKALVGDTIKVSGFVDGVQGRSQVSIDVNGDQKAQVSTQPDGYYQTFIRADSVGTKTVRARSGGKSASRQLEVLPTARVGHVDAPRRIFEGESFSICSEVTSQVDAKVLLLRDGEVVQSTNGNGQVCFDEEAYQPGRHVYEVRALTSGEGSSSKTSVEVLETDVEAESFPDQIASVESGSGMVKVGLYNTHNELKRYNLELEGLPSTWLSQSTREVVLDSGERKEVFFYLTPRDEGDYDPEVIVRADNQEVYRQKVDLETGGQNEPRKKGFFERLSGLFGL